MKARGSIFGLVAAAFLLTAGCAKAPPAAPAGFIVSDLATKPADLPFHRAWQKPGLDLTPYTEIVIAPVNTEHLSKMDWWKKLERGKSLRADAGKLAGYAREVFQEAFREDPKRRFQVVEEAGPQSLVLELALVEVVPSKIVLNTLGYTPIVGYAFKIVRNTKSKSSVAFEARLRDGASGEFLALFADREFEKASLVNVKDVTWYGHAESIIHEWACQFVRVLSRGSGEAVPDSKPFHLKPW